MLENLANKYDVIFNAGEGAFDDGSKTESVKVDFGQNITAPTEEPTREGYEFGGWKDKHGNVYQPGEVAGVMGKDGATFEGWNPEVPEKMPAKTPFTYYTIFCKKIVLNYTKKEKRVKETFTLKFLFT